MTGVTIHSTDMSHTPFPHADVWVSLHSGNLDLTNSATPTGYIMEYPPLAADPTRHVLVGKTVGDVSPETVLVGKDKGYVMANMVLVQGPQNVSWGIEEVEVHFTQKGR